MSNKRELYSHTMKAGALSCVALVVKNSQLAGLPVDITLFLVSLLDQSHRWTLEQASEAGHVHLLRRLAAQEWPDAGRMFRKFRYRNAVLKAATSGQLDVLQWWLFSYLSQPQQPNYEQLFGLAVKHGHLNILQWLQQQGTMPTETLFPIECEHPAVVRWLHDQGSGAMLVVSAAKAASVGDLEFICWLHERETAFFCVKHWLLAASSAACTGHFEVVKWLHKRQPSHEFAKSALNGAVQGGHLLIAQWVYAHDDALSLYCRSNLVAINMPLSRWLMNDFQWTSNHDKQLWLQNTLLQAARRGDLEVLALLYEHRPFMRPANKLLGEAAAYGQLQAAKWLQSNGEKYHRSIAIKAATNGHLDVLRWLLPDMSEDCMMYAGRAAASSGHLELIKWLQAIPNGQNAPRLDWFAGHEMQNAAKNGHLETVKWLYENGFDGNVNLDIVAAHGHLEIVKFLVAHCDARCSSAGLFAAARKGHFAMMEWLFKHDPHIVDPSHLSGLFA